MTRFLVSLMLFAAAGAAGQTWTCESPSNTYRECRIGAGGVVKLVMELSDRACFEGLSWGTREGGIVWVDRGCRAMFTVDNGSSNRRVICESQDGNRHVCAVEPVQDVALLQQLSTTACVEFDNWGFNPDRNQIWVDRGCRAQFVLAKTRGPLPMPRAKVPLLDGVVVCESAGGRRKECAADTSAGVQIIRNLTADNCRFTREWNYDAKGIWVSKGCRAEFAVRGNRPRLQALTCESKNNARAVCAGDLRLGVALVHEFGNNDCLLGTTWGFDDAGVWVTDGCRARFALGGYRLPAGAVPPGATRVRCESSSEARVRCPATTAAGVGLVEQLGESDCVLNRSWGYDRDGIWVRDGCRAEFAVGR